MQLEYDIRGFDTMLIRVRAIEEKVREDIKDVLTEASNRAAEVMQGAVPRDTGRLAASIHQSPIKYAPGGLGGGGFFEAEVSAGEGVPYANVVLEGSGIYYGSGGPITASNGNIRAKINPAWRTTTGAKFMVWRSKKTGRLVRKKAVRGQVPKTAWVEFAQGSARDVVTVGLAEIARKHYL